MGIKTRGHTVPLTAVTPVSPLAGMNTVPRGTIAGSATIYLGTVSATVHAFPVVIDKPAWHALLAVRIAKFGQTTGFAVLKIAWPVTLIAEPTKFTTSNTVTG